MAANLFDSDDAGYLRWVNGNPEGWVVNVRRNMTPDYMVLHKAFCKAISVEDKNRPEGAFTERDYLKVSANDLESLQTWTAQHGRPDADFSKLCSLCHVTKPSFGPVRAMISPQETARLNNHFRILCRLATFEKWCTKIGCTTCGCLHFKYGLLEMANGIGPMSDDWIVRKRKTNYETQLGPLPEEFNDEQRDTLLRVCLDADIATIARTCSEHPQWEMMLDLTLRMLNSGQANSELLLHVKETWMVQWRFARQT
jgi:hypothetical protein